MSTVRTATPEQHVHSADRPPAGSDSAAQQLAVIIAGAKTRHDLYAALVMWLSQRPKVAAAGCFTVGENGALQLGANTFTGPAFDSDAFRSAAATTAEKALQSLTTVTAHVEKIRNVTIICVPLSSPISTSPFPHFTAAEVLTAAIVTSPNEHPDDSLLHLTAAHVGMWHSKQRHSELQQQLQTTAATLDLLSTIETADNLRSGCMALVNTLSEHLQCRGFVLALKKRRRDDRLQVAAVSGLANIDVRSSLTSSLEDTLHECVNRDALSTFPADDSDNRAALLAHHKLCGELQAAKLISHPLKSNDGTIVGAWLAVYDSANVPLDASTLLHAAAPRVADALRLSHQADATFFRRSTKRSRWQWLKRTAVVATMAEQIDILQSGDLGGTMRLGGQECVLTAGSNTAAAYGKDIITERHRHRYEVNSSLVPQLEEAGLRIAGRSVDGELVEVVEVPDHPWFVACQFHPEFTSTPRDGHGLFSAFIKAALNNK